MKTYAAPLIGIGLSLCLCLKASVPRLALVVVFDQMRGDYLWRWQPFWKGGFQKLTAEGFAYRNCFIRHAATVTCAGHATISTGAPPEQHGISGNTIVAKCCKRFLIGCAEDTTGVPSTIWLQLPAVGDLLRQQFPGAKVVSLSHKARAAIMMGGHTPTAVLWLDPEHGKLVSMPGLSKPRWLDEWNRLYSPQQYAGKVWYPSLPAALAPSDSVPWEPRFPGGTCSFPHRVPTEEAEFWDGFLLSPYSVEWLFNAARNAVTHERLGMDSIPDLLWISISTTDFLGHQFGPDSRELLELYLACDRALGEFIRFLDSAVGRSQYVLVLTSDHGVAPIPEMLARSSPGAYPGIDAGRISLDDLTTFLHRKLTQAFGPRAGIFWLSLAPPLLLLHRNLIEGAGVRPDDVRDSLQLWLTNYEGIGIVVPDVALRNSISHTATGVSDSLLALLRRTFPPSQTADLLLYPRPFWIFGTEAATTHGTPYDYDRFVPLVFFGNTVTGGSSAEPTSPEDIAPTIATLLGVSIPTATGKALLLRSAERTQP
ncbi:MAG: alkaline phosphatase family protein [Candidatus Kapabacteria bacterium]|nr:alkaline phosphatase family protein [Candidatus Kapabacteria bacterium]MDW8225318.1 alkaline phosphatase family protein [Bacteroidota bacterium]